MERNTKKVLGYDVDLLSFDNAVNKTMDCISTGTYLHIVTVNPEMIEMANTNKEFAEVLQNAGMVIPDGSGIKLALKLKGINQEQIPGIDFTKRIIELCAKNGHKIAMIGAKEEVIQTAVQNLKNEYSDLQIAYFRNGYFNQDDENEIIQAIAESGAKFVAVALGAPKQEFFIKKCIEKHPNAVYIGVGGSFDVWAGKVERAPKIFRVFGCEWLYRTLKQPERIKRIYKTLPIYLIKIIIEALQKK